MKEAKLLGAELRRTRDWLRIEETRAAAVRKQLRKSKRLNGRRFRGIIDDAVKLASTIEQLARYGQSSSAEEAVDIAFQTEILILLLEVEVDQILTS